jgi:hypothetical protein
LVKKVKHSVHFYRRYKAWTLDSSGYWRSREQFDSLRIEDTKGRVTYTVDANVFDTKAVIINHPPHGEQLALNINYWEKQPSGGHQLQMALDVLQQATSSQPSLLERC